VCIILPQFGREIHCDGVDDIISPPITKVGAHIELTVDIDFTGIGPIVAEISFQTYCDRYF